MKPMRELDLRIACQRGTFKREEHYSFARDPTMVGKLAVTNGYLAGHPKIESPVAGMSSGW